MNQTIAKRRFKNGSVDHHLSELRSLLRRGGFIRETLNMNASLINDLHFQVSDFYFLKLDIEGITQRQVDIDRIFACEHVRDLAELFLETANRTSRGERLSPSPQ